MKQRTIETPIGLLLLVESNDKIIEIRFVESSVVQDESQLLDLAEEQLHAYFSGHRTIFDFPYSQEGTPFQQQVWDALVGIPFATTQSYQQIAEKIQNPKAVRAVGNANNKNHLAIVVPCHRVIGKNRSLVGYAGGLSRKQWLLDHELNVKKRST